MAHTNLLFEADALAAVLDVRPGRSCHVGLPSAHIADRIMALYNQELYGILVTVISDVREIAAALPDARPTIWAAVPRVWEKLKAGIEFAVGHGQDETQRQALRWALSVAPKRAAALVADEPLPDDVAAEWAQADELVLSKLREKRGWTRCDGRCRVRRRFRGRRWLSLSVSASRSQRSGACRS